MADRTGHSSSGGGDGKGRRPRRRTGLPPPRGDNGPSRRQPRRGATGQKGAPGEARKPERRPRTGQQRPRRPLDPPTDPDVTGRELDPSVRDELRTLPGDAAGAVARHLVMAGRLLDEDPEAAYQHTLAARRRAARIGVVREATGVAAYLAGRYADALAELRTARRLTGSPAYLPMMADCERGLGRPRRALDLAADPAVAGLDPAGRAEILIVAAGARRDLGQVEAAVASLQVPELRTSSTESWVARLRYAYADCLLEAGRSDEARVWFIRAATADAQGDTDAAARAAGMDGIVLVEEPEEPEEPTNSEDGSEP